MEHHFDIEIAKEYGVYLSKDKTITIEADDFTVFRDDKIVKFKDNHNERDMRGNMWFENENCKEKIKAVMQTDDTVVIVTENGRVLKLIYDEKEKAEEAHNMIERGIRID